jgi:hypothetical protein
LSKKRVSISAHPPISNTHSAFFIQKTWLETKKK